MSAPFVCEVPVRFADVDHAGVVYYPQYLDYCHVAFEEFMRAGLGKPYSGVVREEGLGYPAVRLECDYTAPSRFGDVLRIAVTCTGLGTKSVTLRYRIECAGELRVDAHVTTACIDMAEFSALPIPAAHRRHFEAHAAS